MATQQPGQGAVLPGASVWIFTDGWLLLTIRNTYFLPSDDPNMFEISFIGNGIRAGRHLRPGAALWRKSNHSPANVNKS